MKIKWNEKYTTISIYTFLVICSSIVFYNIASEFGSLKINFEAVASVLQPFFIGFVIAYSLNFILKFIEHEGFKYFPSLKPKGRRILGILLTYLSVVLFFYIFIAFVFPQLASSLMGLVNNIPEYVKDMSDLFEDTSSNINLSDKYMIMVAEKWNELLDDILGFTTDLIPLFGDILKNVASKVSNIILGFVISIYLLMDKEKFFALGRKVTFAIFPDRVSAKILELLDRTNLIFGKFISGKLLDSFIVGCITFMLLLVFKMPYATLISFIIGITNIVPFFGPFIGALPSFLIILFVSPIQALWFLVIIVFIQQLDGNVIGPKILGDSLGISAFWILFSLLIGSKLLGVVGMIIGVPVFAVLYSIFKDFIESRLRKKGCQTETSGYMQKIEEVEIIKDNPDNTDL